VLAAAGVSADVRTIDLLLSHGVDVRSSLALHSAAEAAHADLEGRHAVMEHLFRLGMDINALDSDLLVQQGRDLQGRPLNGTTRQVAGTWGTPLARAVRRRDLETAKWLLERGADPNVESCFGETPLDLAETKEFWPFVELVQGLE
jgi:hypothetical protein